MIRISSERRSSIVLTVSVCVGPLISRVVVVVVAVALLVVVTWIPRRVPLVIAVVVVVVSIAVWFLESRILLRTREGG